MRAGRCRRRMGDDRRRPARGRRTVRGQHGRGRSGMGVVQGHSSGRRVGGRVDRRLRRGAGTRVADRERRAAGARGARSGRGGGIRARRGRRRPARLGLDVPGRRRVADRAVRGGQGGGGGDLARPVAEPLPGPRRSRRPALRVVRAACERADHLRRPAPRRGLPSRGGPRRPAAGGGRAGGRLRGAVRTPRTRRVARRPERRSRRALRRKRAAVGAARGEHGAAGRARRGTSARGLVLGAGVAAAPAGGPDALDRAPHR